MNEWNGIAGPIRDIPVKSASASANVLLLARHVKMTPSNATIARNVEVNFRVMWRGILDARNFHL